MSGKNAEDSYGTVGPPPKAASASVTTSNDEKQMAVRLNPDLAYEFRDVFSLHPDTETFVLELGTRHRGRNACTIYERVVLPFSTAVRLQQQLTRKIQAVQQAVRDEATKQATKT